LKPESTPGLYFPGQGKGHILSLIEVVLHFVETLFAKLIWKDFSFLKISQ